MTESVKIRGEYIRLCDLLKFCAVASTGGEAKLMITDGTVTVNGEPCLQKGRKIRAGDRVAVGDKTIEVCGETS